MSLALVRATLIASRCTVDSIALVAKSFCCAYGDNEVVLWHGDSIRVWCLRKWRVPFPGERSRLLCNSDNNIGVCFELVKAPRWCALLLGQDAMLCS